MDPEILPDLNWNQLWSSVLRDSNEGEPRSFSLDLAAIGNFAATLSGAIGIELPAWWAGALLAVEVRYHNKHPIPFFPANEAGQSHRSYLAGIHFLNRGKSVRLSADASSRQPAPFSIELYSTDRDVKLWHAKILSNFKPTPIGGRGFHYIEFYSCSRREKIFIFGHGPTELYAVSVDVSDGQILDSFTLDCFDSEIAG